MLSTKADANRKHTLTLSISKLVSLLISKTLNLFFCTFVVYNKTIIYLSEYHHDSPPLRWIIIIYIINKWWFNFKSFETYKIVSFQSQILEFF